MNKKYEFTGETKIYSNKILYHIRALKDIRKDVKAGDLGGWIENEGNLSQYGDAWTTTDVMVMDNARVTHDAWVTGYTQVIDHAWIWGNARVENNVTVKGNAWIANKAQVTERAIIADNARILGNAKVAGNARIGGNVWIIDNAQIIGDARIESNEWIANNAYITGSYDYIAIGPIGSRNDYTTFYRTKNKTIAVVCGCFKGTIDEFEQAVRDTHGDNQHSKIYTTTIQYVKNILK